MACCPSVNFWFAVSLSILMVFGDFCTKILLINVQGLRNVNDAGAIAESPSE
jgi:hypothetical protein